MGIVRERLTQHTRSPAIIPTRRRVPRPTPEVAAYIEASHDVWTLLIACPYCRRLHMHGGGSIDGPPVLGQRISHCLNGGYVLVAGPPEMPKPTSRRTTRKDHRS